MNFLCSSLAQPEELPQDVQRWLHSGVLQWAPPEDLIASTAQGQVTPNAKPPVVLWCYRAPWLLRQDSEELHIWLNTHKTVLRQRYSDGRRWVFLNLDSFEAPQLASALNAIASEANGGLAVAGPRFAPHHGQWSEQSNALPSGSPGPGSEVLPYLYSVVAPEYWDVLEGLESVGVGSADPLLRESLPPVSFQAVVTHQVALSMGVLAHQRAVQLEQQVAELGHRAAEFAHQHRAEMGDAERTVRTLEAELERAQQQANAQAGAYEQALADLNEQSARDLDVMRTKAALAASRVRELEETLQRVEHRLAQVELLRQDERIAHTNAALALERRLAQSLSDAEVRHAELLAGAQERHSADVAALVLEREELQSKLAALQAESDELLTQLHATQQEYENLYLSTKAQAEALGLRVSELQQRQDELQSELSAQTDRRLAAEAEAANLVQGLAEAVAAREQERAAADSALRQAIAQRDAQEQHRLEQIAEFQAAVSDREQLQASVSVLQAESDELLTQLHAVQEEYEGLYLSTKAQSDEAQRQIQALQLGHEQLQAQLAQERAASDLALGEVVAQREAQVKSLEGQLAHLQEALKAAQRDHDAMRGQWESAAAKARTDADGVRQKAEAEAEKSRATAASALSQLEQAQRRASELEASMQTATTAIAQFEAARQAERAANERLQARSKDLLLQLHTVQETLEEEHIKARDQAEGAKEREQALMTQLQVAQAEVRRYYRKSAGLEESEARVRSLLARLQERYPQEAVFDRVAIVAADAAEQVPSITWRIAGLVVRGVESPELTVRTSLHEGKPGIELGVDGDLAQISGGVVIPHAVSLRDNQQLSRFVQMASRPWRSVQLAASAVEQQLADPQVSAQGTKDFDPEFWRQSLAGLAASLRALPAVFRFDSVRLKREKRNPDYEHLWLEFEGAAYGDTELPELDLRISAAEVTPENFSTLPKIEIPLTRSGKPPFAGWFKESEDEYGDKLELRADIASKSFDVGVWSRLPSPSQSLLLSWIAALPRALERLPEASRLGRPIDQWRALLASLIDVMRSRLASPAPAGQRARAQDPGSSEAKPQAPVVDGPRANPFAARASEAKVIAAPSVAPAPGPLPGPGPAAPTPTPTSAAAKTVKSKKTAVVVPEKSVPAAKLPSKSSRHGKR